MSEEKDFVFNDYIKPTRDYVVLEELKMGKVNGIFIPDGAEETAIGLKVVAIGPQVTSVNVGDLAIPNGALQSIELFNKKWLWASEVSIVGVITPEGEEYNNICRIAPLTSNGEHATSGKQILLGNNDTSIIH